jgi:secretion/DNA translocation related TadE-like protein
LRDRGSASVLVLAMAAVVGLAGGVAAELGLSVAARHHLAAVADAASLAAAAVVVDGAQGACATARSVARRNRVALANCRVTGPVVIVRLRARLGWPLGWLPALTLNSRAGPAETITDHSGQAAAAS